MLSPSIIFFLLFSLTLLKMLLELYLSKRNARCLLANREAIPAAIPQEIQGSMSLQQYQKSIDYQLVKGKVGRFFLLLDFLYWCFFIFFGLHWCHQMSIILTANVMLQSIIFIGLFSFLSTLLDLPASLYNQFVIEEKFGFNKMTLRDFFQDFIKSLMISIVLGVPFLFIFFSIMEANHPLWWFYGFLFFFLFQLLLLFIYPSLIAPLFNKFTTLPNGELKDKLFALVKRTIPDFTEIFMMDASKRSTKSNAYFTGFGKNKRIVLFDTLCQSLSSDELESVLAHEIGHYARKHILKSLIQGHILLLGGFWFLGFLKNYTPFYEAFGIPQSNPIFLVLALLVLPQLLFFISPLFSYFSRKNEFEADDYAKQHSSGKALERALIKLNQDNYGTLTPDPLFVFFYYSHPPLIQRLMAIQGTKRD